MAFSFLALLQQQVKGPHSRQSLEPLLRSEPVAVILRALPKGSDLWTDTCHNVDVCPALEATSLHHSGPFQGQPSLDAGSEISYNSARGSYNEVHGVVPGFRSTLGFRAFQGRQLWTESRARHSNGQFKWTVDWNRQAGRFCTAERTLSSSRNLASSSGQLETKEVDSDVHLKDSRGQEISGEVRNGEDLFESCGERPSAKGDSFEWEALAIEDVGWGDEDRVSRRPKKAARTSDETDDTSFCSDEAFEKASKERKVSRGGLRATDLKRKAEARVLKSRQKAERKIEEKVDVDKLLTAVLVGRANVGKSSLFNRLTRRQEALVYNTPAGHVTRDHREGVARMGDLRLRLVDTAGLEPTAGSDSVLARTAKITQGVLGSSQLALFLLDGRDEQL